MLPGSYGRIMLYASSKLQLSPGVYKFRTFKTEPNVSIECDMTATDTVEVHVFDSLDIRDGSRIYPIGQTQPSPRSIRFYSNQAGIVSIHPSDTIYAMITTPNAELHIYPYTQFSGIAYGLRVYIEPNVSFDGSSSYLVDSDGDGVPDVVEIAPWCSTDPRNPHSYKFVSMVDTAIVTDNTQPRKIKYDFSKIADYSNCSNIVMNVAPQTLGLNEVVPIYEAVNPDTLSYVDVAGKKHALIGTAFQLHGNILPGKTLSLPIPIPNNFRMGIGAKYRVKHIKDNGAGIEDVPIDSVTSRAVFVQATSFSIYEAYTSIDNGSATAYVGNQAVFARNANSAPEISISFELDNSLASSDDVNLYNSSRTAKLIVQYASRDASGVIHPSNPVEEPLTLSGHAIMYKGKLPFPGASDIVLQSLTFYSAKDGISASNPYVRTFTSQEGGDVLTGEKAYVTSKFTNYIPSNVPVSSGLVTLRKYSGFYLDYYNITSASGVEGRMAFAGPDIDGSDQFDNYFYVKDHLGSTRMTVKYANQAFNVVEATMYESYGAMEPVLVNAGTAEPTRDKFTGKEFDNDGEDDANGVPGLGLFYFGARYYDPEIGRWTSTDPKEQFPDEYQFCDNNPIYNFDPDGKQVPFMLGAAGAAAASTGVGIQGIYLSGPGYLSPPRGTPGSTPVYVPTLQDIVDEVKELQQGSSGEPRIPNTDPEDPKNKDKLTFWKMTAGAILFLEAAKLFEECLESLKGLATEIGGTQSAPAVQQIVPAVQPANVVPNNNQ